MLNKLCCGYNTDRKKLTIAKIKRPQYPIWVMYPSLGNNAVSGYTRETPNPCLHSNLRSIIALPPDQQQLAPYQIFILHGDVSGFPSIIRGGEVGEVWTRGLPITSETLYHFGKLDQTKNASANFAPPLTLGLSSSLSSHSLLHPFPFSQARKFGLVAQFLGYGSLPTTHL